MFWQDLKIPSIDLYTGHYYPLSTSSLLLQTRLAHDADKVFIVGEYDWNTSEGDTLDAFLAAVLNSNVAGDMYWSLFSHADQYGYVAQNEHYTLHYPGDTPDMRQRIEMLRAHAYAMQGTSLPADGPPGAPYLTSVHDRSITWRGAFGADRYTVERSTKDQKGPWTIICDRCATDGSTPWMDMTQPYQTVWYRVKGYSVSGLPGPYSNIVAYVRKSGVEQITVPRLPGFISPRTG